MTGTASLLPIAHEAVDIARELILARAPGSIQAKGDRDFASEVDVEVERAVRDFLGRLTSGIGIGFLGEEEGARGAQSDLVWTLDPLDGTSNFIHGIPLCAVVLGLVEQRGSVLGVIDLPLVGARYFGVRSAGAYVGERRLRARPTRSLRDAVVSVGDYAVGVDAERKNRLRLAITYRLAAQAERVRMLGPAAVDLAWTAEGKLDASITLSNKPWEMAAGVLIARDAGVQVFDWDGTPHGPGSSATVAVAGSLASSVLALVREAEQASRSTTASRPATGHR